MSPKLSSEREKRNTLRNQLNDIFLEILAVESRSKVFITRMDQWSCDDASNCDFLLNTDDDSHSQLVTIIAFFSISIDVAL